MKKIIGKILPFEWNRHGKVLKFCLQSINEEEFIISSSKVNFNFDNLINQKLMFLVKEVSKNSKFIAIHGLKRFD